MARWLEGRIQRKWNRCARRQSAWDIISFRKKAIKVLVDDDTNIMKGKVFFLGGFQRLRT